MPLLVCAVATLLYLPTVRFGFVYDDHYQIENNPLLHSWKYLPWIFKTDVWAFLHPLVVGNYWRPLFMLWALINYTLFGQNPAGWHASAVLTHVVATYFVYKLAEELGADSLLAGIAGLLFAVHPAHLETVAWISGATDSLMADFLLPSLICFIRGWKSANSRQWVWYSGSAVLYFCALLTKEPAVVMPVFAAAYVLFFHRGEWNQSLRQRAAAAFMPLTIAVGLYLFARSHVLHGVSHPFVKMSWGRIFVTVPSLLWFYIQHLVWPVRLGVYYELPPVLNLKFANFWFPLFAVIAVIGGIGWIAWRTRDRLIAIAGIIALLPIVPVLYIPALPIDDFVHDRYLYLPSVGFVLIVASLIRKLEWGSAKVFQAPAIQVVTALIVILGLSASTSAQQLYWNNDLLLFSRAVDVAPGSGNAFNNLGIALMGRGRTREAMFAFQQVIKRNPDDALALYNLGLGNFADGKYPEAEAYLSKSLKISPTEGDTAALLAECQIRQGKFADGERAIRHAIAVKPYKPGYRRVLALALEGQGKLAEATEAAEQELKANPNDPETKQLLSRLQGQSTK